MSLIEVKRGELTSSQADDQMIGYMHRALEQGSFSEDFRGHLVMGQEGYQVMDQGVFTVELIVLHSYSIAVDSSLLRVRR